MREIARGSLTPVQVEETLEYLVKRYRHQLELHKIKSDTTRLKAFIVSTADVVAGFRGRKGAELFSLEHRRMPLLEGEPTQPAAKGRMQ